MFSGQLFYARLPQHQQPFIEQEDPLWHPAVSDTWKAREPCVTHGDIFGFLYRSHKQNISRDWTNAPAVAWLIHKPPNRFSRGRGGSTSSHCMVKLIRDIRQTLLFQTSVVKLISILVIKVEWDSPCGFSGTSSFLVKVVVSRCWNLI